MFEALAAAPSLEAVKELARTMQTIIVFYGLTMMALVGWLGYLQEKLGKLKKQLRQLEDWKLQAEARSFPKV